MTATKASTSKPQTTLQSRHIPRLNHEMGGSSSGREDSQLVTDALEEVRPHINDALMVNDEYGKRDLLAQFDPLPISRSQRKERVFGVPDLPAASKNLAPAHERLRALRHVLHVLEASFSQPEAALFDFEVEAIDRLVALGNDLAALRQNARETVQAATACQELGNIYAKVTASRRGTQAHSVNTDGDGLSPSTELSEEEATAVEESRNALRPWVAKFCPGRDPDDFVRTVSELRGVRETSPRETGGQAGTQRLSAVRAAEEVFADFVLDRGVKRGGLLSKYRGYVSGVYEARAREFPYPEHPKDSDAVEREATEAAAFASTACRYATLVAPDDTDGWRAAQVFMKGELTLLKLGARGAARKAWKSAKKLSVRKQVPPSGGQ